VADANKHKNCASLSKQDLYLDFLLRLKLDLKLDLMKSTSTTYFLANSQALDALITLLDSLPARGLAINDTWATVRYFNKHDSILVDFGVDRHHR
jgi:hypothetical protein